MNLGCSHIMLNASDLAAAKSFYITTLGLELIEAFPRMFAFRAGELRFSVFEGGIKQEADAEDPPATIIFRTDDLDAAIAELRSKNVVFEGDVQLAPNFMRFAALLDPDGNRLYLAQYLADPLVANIK